MRSALTILILALLVIAGYLAFTRYERRGGDLGLGRESEVNPGDRIRSGPEIAPETLTAEVEEAIAQSEPYPFDFSLVSTHGGTVAKQDFAGRVLIVDIWGTWCPPCRDEIPHFVELQNEYREQGLSIVGINYENTSTREEAIEAIASFTEEVPINYPLLIGDEATQQQVPNFQGFPTTLFIDRDGRVRLTLVGARPKHELEAVVKVLLEDEAVEAASPAPAATS